MMSRLSSTHLHPTFHFTYHYLIFMQAFIIVAGGKGLRVGGPIPKQFMPLDGKPVLMYSIEAFHKYSPESQIILVLPKSHFEYWEQLCKDHKFTVAHEVVEGGKERFFSVKNALLAVDGADYVSIHDGVRPLVSQELIQRCMEEVREKQAVIPAVPLNDSIRKIKGAENKAVERSNYRLIQTPQVFHYPKLMMAYRTAYSDSFTDDASVWEAAGRKVYLTEGENSNIKITRSSDFKMASLFLEEKKSERT